jgi:hypothetical protein
MSPFLSSFSALPLISTLPTFVALLKLFSIPVFCFQRRTRNTHGAKRLAVPRPRTFNESPLGSCPCLVCLRGSAVHGVISWDMYVDGVRPNYILSSRASHGPHSIHASQHTRSSQIQRSVALSPRELTILTEIENRKGKYTTDMVWRA